MSKHRAFTLIEILIYTGIFAIVGGMLTGILINATRVEQRESASAEVGSQLNFVMQTIQRLVRESSNIEIEAGTATSTLKLRMKDSAKDPTYISLSNNAIKLQEGSSATTTLTSDRVVVNTLSFKKFTQYPGHDTVSIDLTMTYNTSNTAGQVQRTLSSAIARVSAATFDADLLPGTDNTYSIGFNPSTRWKDGTFAGNLTVNGNVGIGTTNPTNGRLEVNAATGQQGLYVAGASGQLAGYFYQGNSSSPTLYVRGGLSTDATFEVANVGGTTLFKIQGGGNVGIATTTPASKLTVVGTIESTSGGFKFPDATTQTSAASSAGLPGSIGQNSANNATTPNTQFDLYADAVILKNSANNTVVRWNPGTITNNSSTTGPTANGRDQSGEFLNSSWVHFYWIWNGTTLATLSSATAPPTGPTLPSGYTHWAYAAAIRKDASGNLLKMRAKGNRIFYEAEVQVLGNGRSTTEAAVDVSSAVPPNALFYQMHIYKYQHDNTGEDAVHFRVVTGVDYTDLAWRGDTSHRDYFHRDAEFPNVSQQFYYLDPSVTAVSGTYAKVMNFTLPNGGT